MSLKYPTSPKVIADRMRTDIKKELPESNPFLENSFLNSDIIATAGSIFQAYALIQELEKNLFADTATGAFLDRWGAIWGVNRNAASQAEGLISINGVPGSVVPSGTLFNSENNLNYLTVEEKTIIETQIAFDSYSFTAYILTFTGSNKHNLATGNEVVVTGFNEAQANGTFEVNVEDEYTFSYEVPDLMSTPTGTPIVVSDMAFIKVQSVDYGNDTNQMSGAILDIGSTIAGVDQSAYVQYGEISGGADVETDERYKERVLFRIRNQPSPFSNSDVILKAREVPGVTRVFIKEKLGGGDIYFTQDDLDNNIPTATVVQKVKDKIDEIAPTMGLRRINVSAPTPKVVNISLQTITPDIPSMRKAIRENLQDYFRNETKIGENIKNRSLWCAIESTVDLETGKYLENFNLISPGGDIVLNENEIAVLGTISYAV